MTNTRAIDLSSNDPPTSLTGVWPCSWLRDQIARLPGIWRLDCRRVRRGYLLKALGVGVVALVGGCSVPAPPVPRQIVLQQRWELEAGDRVAGQLVVAGLGDVSLKLRGDRLVAPFAGQVELAAKGVGCIYFSAPEVPAYLFRYCGVRHPHLGWRQAGQPMAQGRSIHFATLRRLPDGAWAIVEPSHHVLEQSFKPATLRLSF